MREGGGGVSPAARPLTWDGTGGQGMIVRLQVLTCHASRRAAMALEYALVLAFVTITVLAALVTLGNNVQSSVGTVGNVVSTAGSAFTSP